MSVDRSHGQISFLCDDCEDVFDTGEEEFSLALAQLRRASWRNVSVAGEWEHYCDKRGCRAAANKASQRHPPRRRSSDVDEMS